MPNARTLRFLLQFLRNRPNERRERESLIASDGGQRALTVYWPTRAKASRAAWVLLQGIAVPGRHHDGVRRMARALAAAGFLVATPEVPGWTALRVDPSEGESAVSDVLHWFDTHLRQPPARIGLMGFSIAGTWAFEMAGGRFAGRIGAAASLGGYGDIHRTVRAMISGRHEWRGKSYSHTPDPYGRWILGADLLPQIEGDAYGSDDDRQRTADALRHLAMTAGRNGAIASAPVYVPLATELRRTIPAASIAAWDILAPTRAAASNGGDADALAAALSRAAVKSHPELDPTGRLSTTAQVTLIHGREDRLVPFTETLRLASMLPDATPSKTTITQLVGHAKPRGWWTNPPLLVREAWQFARAIDWMIDSLDP